MRAEGQDDWRVRTVQALIKPAAAVVASDLTVQQLFAQLPKRPVTRVYVTDDKDLVAWLDPRQLLEDVKQGKVPADAVVASVAHPISFTLNPEMSLSAALEGFLREQVAVLPVTPGQWHSTLLGEVSRHDLLLAVQDRLTYPK
jgi:CIC family chloride channel protein